MFSVQKMENTISPGPESSINSSVLDSKMLWRFSLIKEKYKQRDSVLFITRQENLFKRQSK